MWVQLISNESSIWYSHCCHCGYRRVRLPIFVHIQLIGKLSLVCCGYIWMGIYGHCQKRKGQFIRDWRSFGWDVKLLLYLGIQLANMRCKLKSAGCVHGSLGGQCSFLFTASATQGFLPSLFKEKQKLAIEFTIASGNHSQWICPPFASVNSR